MISTTMKLLLILNVKQSFLLKVFYLLPVERKRTISFGLFFFIKKLPLKKYTSYEIKVEISDQLKLKNQLFIFPYEIGKYIYFNDNY